MQSISNISTVCAAQPHDTARLLQSTHPAYALEENLPVQKDPLDNSIVEISYPLLFNWQSSCKLLFPSEWRVAPVRARALSRRAGDTGTAEGAHPVHSPLRAPPRCFNIRIH